MSSHIRRLQANTRERILSTDWNNATALHHRALIEAGAALLQGDANLWGVVKGLTVSASGADTRVTVATGLALRSGSAATTYDSPTQWIELRSATTVDLSGLIDPANPRWAVIEIVEASATETSEARDIFDPVTGTFSSSSVVKVTGSSPTISSRAGTAAANPVFPRGAAGVIPLAYVYLGAAAATINATDIVMCRPMLRSDTAGDQSAPQRDVYGGGVEVAAAGLALSLRNAGGRFSNHRVRWGISAADGTTAYTLAAQGMDGAALPVVDDIIYFYACPPPYPSGYDTNLAPREHRPGTTALTRYQNLVVADVYNAVIVASAVEPQANSPIGSPTAGNFSIECAPFSATGVPVVFDRSTAFYLGTGFYDFGVGFLAQAYLGSGETRWTQSALTSIPWESDVRNATVTGPNTGDAWVASPLTAAGAQIVPNVAAATIVEFSQASANASVVWAYGLAEDAGPTIASGSGTGGSRRSFVRLRTRAFVWSHSETFGTTSTLNFVVRGWIDGVLAQR